MVVPVAGVRRSGDPDGAERVGAGDGGQPGGPRGGTPAGAPVLGEGGAEPDHPTRHRRVQVLGLWDDHKVEKVKGITMFRFCYVVV